MRARAHCYEQHKHQSRVRTLSSVMANSSRLVALLTSNSVSPLVVLPVVVLGVVADALLDTLDVLDSVGRRRAATCAAMRSESSWCRAMSVPSMAAIMILRKSARSAVRVRTGE
jgi:hypothetical protein